MLLGGQFTLETGPGFAAYSSVIRAVVLCFNVAVLFVTADSALRIVSRFCPQHDQTPESHWIALKLGTGILVLSAFAILTIILGLYRALSSPVALLGGSACLLIGFYVASSPFRRNSRRPPLIVPNERVLLLLFLSVLPAFVLLLLCRWGNPPSSWDALTYHLTHPLHWLESGTLETLHQTTGDPSSAYYPIGAESFYMWAYLACGSDWWVPIAQLPPAIFGGLATYGIATSLGLSSRYALMASLLWITTPVLFRQVGEAENDIWISAWLLASFFFGLRSAVSPLYLLFSLMAAGLALGTKYLAIVYSPVLVLPWIFAKQRQQQSAGLSRRAALVVGFVLMVVLGGFAYIRNLATCGNPLAPMALSISGHQLLPGFLSARDFFSSAERNLTIKELFFSVRALADGGASFLLAFVGLLIGCVALSKRNDRTTAVFTWSAILSMLIFLFLVPNRHHRFAAFPIGLALPLIVGRLSPHLLGLSLVINLAGASIYVAKGFMLGPFPILWSSWSSFLALTIVVGLAAVRICPHLLRRSMRLVVSVLVILVLVALSALIPNYEERRFRAWEFYWGQQRARAKGMAIQKDRSDWAQCWSRSAEVTRGTASVIAYAGSNIPYPLRGHALENKVLSIPPTIDCKDPFYDWGHDQFNPSSPLDPAGWLQRLEAHSVDFLCIFREEDRPWPPEMEWAKSRPSFELLWQAEHAAIFSVEPE